MDDELYSGRQCMGKWIQYKDIIRGLTSVEGLRRTRTVPTKKAQKYS